MQFESKAHARIWMDSNQLGRRNLSPDAFKLALGRRYNRTKKQGTRTDILSDNVSQSPINTAESLAKAAGVSTGQSTTENPFA